jgi:asparagine synthase (glutamine-hydrolysing)
MMLCFFIQGEKNMCSIFGYEAFDIPQAKLECEFQKTHHRGPDATRFVRTDIGYLGFHRLSIMGLTEAGMQPFSLGQDQVVCNGELYGFRQIRERLSLKHEFKSDSDCEVILPLFQEVGCEMFAKLDSEFAMIIYDGKHQRLIAARDPIGIRPLYYGYTEHHHIMLLLNRCHWLLFASRFCLFHQDIITWMEHLFVTVIPPWWKPITDVVDVITKNIHDKLVKAVEKRLDADAPLGFLLSGGLDSHWFVPLLPS